MPIPNAGRDYVASAILGLNTGAAGTALAPFTNANAAIGVGDSSAAHVATHTNLQAATNRLRKGMQAGSPSVAGNVITAVSQFIGTEANWAWLEAAFFNSATDAVGTMFARGVGSWGTKASGAVWTATMTITVSSS